MGEDTAVARQLEGRGWSPCGGGANSLVLEDTVVFAEEGAEEASPQGPSAIKGVVPGLKKCLQVVKTLIKKKGGVYFCDPVSVLFRCPAPSSSYLVSQIAHVRGKRSQKGS